MKQYGVGIIGFGGRGRSLDLPIRSRFAKRLKLLGYVETDPVRLAAAEAWVKEFKGAATPDLDAFLAREDLDLVLVCTPQFAHAEPAIKALQAGKHTFVEKPMATSVADCNRILEARDASQRELFMGFNLRSHPVTLKLKELITEGKIGKPQTLVCTDFYANGGTYFRRWHRFHEKSGGLMVEKGCHSLDLINWFIDAPPLYVSSFGGLDVFKPRAGAAQHCRDCELFDQCAYSVSLQGTKIKEYGHDPDRLDLCVYNTEKDTFDNHMMLIEYANGCRAVYVESFVSRVRAKSGRQFMINGPKGQIWSEYITRSISLLASHSGVDGIVTNYNLPLGTGNHGGADEAQLQYIVECLDGRRPNLLRGELGRDAVMLAEAAEIAAKERRVVEIQEFKSA